MATDALAQTLQYQVALNKYVINQDRWPTRAADAGLPPENTKPGGAIRSLSFGERGTITVTFDENLAPATPLQLVPQADAQTGQMRWQCRFPGRGGTHSLPARLFAGLSLSWHPSCSRLRTASSALAGPYSSAALPCLALKLPPDRTNCAMNA